jgi:asparagine synthetase B (glutamine-hydrolysing)
VELDEYRPSLFRSAVRLARHSLRDDIGCISVCCSQMLPPQKRTLFRPEFYRRFGKDNEAYFDGHAGKGLEPFSLAKLMHVDRRTYLAEDLMCKVDRMAMANSLEVRCPFLDYRLVESSMGLAERDLIRGGVGKVVLRRLSARYLPDEIVRRPKKGFSVPMGELLRNELRPVFESVVRPRPVLSDVLDYEEIARRFRLHVDRRQESGNQLWLVLAFHIWADKYGADGAS